MDDRQAVDHPGERKMLPAGRLKSASAAAGTPPPACLLLFRSRRRSVARDASPVLLAAVSISTGRIALFV